MSVEKLEQQNKVWSEIVAKAWADKSFRQRVMADPKAVLQEHGVQVPGDVQIIVSENTDKVRHLTLPRKASDELAEEDLERVAGGVSCADTLAAKPIARR